MDYQDLEPFREGNLPIQSNHKIPQILILTNYKLGTRERQPRLDRVLSP